MPLLSYSGSSQELQKGDEIDSDTDMFVTFIVKDLHTLPVRPRNKSLKSSKISLATYLMYLIAQASIKKRLKKETALIVNEV